MSLLSELNTIAGSCAIPVETGVFTDPAPDTYLVQTTVRASTRRRCGFPCSAARII